MNKKTIEQFALMTAEELACVEGGNQVFAGGGENSPLINLGGQKLIGAQSQVALMGE